MKHSGVVIAKADMDAFRITVADFFEENTPKVFGVTLAKVSMASLVRYDDVRLSLEEAEAFAGMGDTEEAAKKVAVAFQQLLQISSWNSFGGGRRLPLEYATRLSYPSMRSIPPELKSFAEEVKGAIDTLTKKP